MSFKGYVKFLSFERDFYDKLSRIPEIDEPSLTYAQLLNISEGLSPSISLGTGGLMFELFVLRFGIARHRKVIVEEKVESKLKDEIVKRYILQFWFECISKLPMVKRRSNTQLYLATMALEYRGLSRLGIQFLALCGVATNPRTYDRKRLVSLKNYGESIGLQLSLGGYVICFDNYCHQYFMPRLSTNRDKIMLQTNCTVVAASVTQEYTDTRFVRTPSGRVLPSVPPAKHLLYKYVQSFIDDLKNALCDIGDSTGDNYKYWPIARVVIDNVRKVPAELDAPNPTDENHDHSRGLKNFRPLMVSADHPSSNEGTANTMTRVFKMCKDVLQHSYVFARVDIDPWMKWLRVCFLQLIQLIFS